MGRRKKTVGVSTITGEDVGLPAKAADGGGGSGGGEAGRDEERMVMPEVKTCLLLVAVLAIQVVGVYLFTSGFLLTRNELPYVAACPPESALGGACMLPPSVSGPRGTPPYKRAVVVLIDALRFDFMAWDAGLEQAMAEQARKQDDRLADGDRVAFGGGVRVLPGFFFFFFFLRGWCRVVVRVQLFVSVSACASTAAILPLRFNP